MAGNFSDQPGVIALARELGVAYTLDPTITPKMDGDRSILALRIPGSDLKQVFHNQELVGNVEEFCAPPPRTRRRHHGRFPVQRRSHRLLHFSLRRCISLRAISSSQRQCAAAEIPRHLAPFPAVEGGPLDPCQGSSDLFDLRPRGNVHALPRLGLHGGQHARAVHRRLRKVFPENGHPLGKHAGTDASRFRGSTDSDPGPGKLIPRSRFFKMRRVNCE